MIIPQLHDQSTSNLQQQISATSSTKETPLRLSAWVGSMKGSIQATLGKLRGTRVSGSVPSSTPLILLSTTGSTVSITPPLCTTSAHRHLSGNNNNNVTVAYNTSFSTSSITKTPDIVSYVNENYKVHRRGPPGHGSREYLLLPPSTKITDGHVMVVNQTFIQDDPSLPAAATLLAHRNIIFGSRVFIPNTTVQEVCGPLVRAAIQDAEEYGEQPQGMAQLSGLCSWVANNINPTTNMTMTTTTTSTIPSRQTIQKLQSTTTKSDREALEAVTAIATGIPRPGHSVVGQGTYRDGADAWKELATEFIELQLCDEANLFQDYGGRLVAIEPMADTNPNYLKTAGGAMARFFFL